MSEALPQQPPVDHSTQLSKGTLKPDNYANYINGLGTEDQKKEARIAIGDFLLKAWSDRPDPADNPITSNYFEGIPIPEETLSQGDEPEAPAAAPLLPHPPAAEAQIIQEDEETTSVIDIQFTDDLEPKIDKKPWRPMNSRKVEKAIINMFHQLGITFPFTADKIDYGLPVSDKPDNLTGDPIFWFQIEEKEINDQGNITSRQKAINNYQDLFPQIVFTATTANIGKPDQIIYNDLIKTFYRKDGSPVSLTEAGNLTMDRLRFKLNIRPDVAELLTREGLETHPDLINQIVQDLLRYAPPGSEEQVKDTQFRLVFPNGNPILGPAPASPAKPAAKPPSPPPSRPPAEDPAQKAPKEALKPPETTQELGQRFNHAYLTAQDPFKFETQPLAEKDSEYFTTSGNQEVGLRYHQGTGERAENGLIDIRLSDTVYSEVYGLAITKKDGTLIIIENNDDFINLPAEKQTQAIKVLTETLIALGYQPDQVRFFTSDKDGPLTKAEEMITARQKTREKEKQASAEAPQSFEEAYEQYGSAVDIIDDPDKVQEILTSQFGYTALELANRNLTKEKLSEFKGPIIFKTKLRGFEAQFLIFRSKDNQTTRLAAVVKVGETPDFFPNTQAEAVNQGIPDRLCRHYYKEGTKKPDQELERLGPNFRIVKVNKDVTPDVLVSQLNDFSPQTDREKVVRDLQTAFGRQLTDSELARRFSELGITFSGSGKI